MAVRRSMKALHLGVSSGTIKLLRVDLSEGTIVLRLIGDLVFLDLAIKDRH
jgi:hypothetical protein